jgi:hypothetical protein
MSVLYANSCGEDIAHIVTDFGAAVIASGVHAHAVLGHIDHGRLTADVAAFARLTAPADDSGIGASQLCYLLLPALALIAAGVTAVVTVRHPEVSVAGRSDGMPDL